MNYDTKTGSSSRFDGGDTIMTGSANDGGIKAMINRIMDHCINLHSLSVLVQKHDDALDRISKGNYPREASGISGIPVGASPQKDESSLACVVNQLDEIVPRLHKQLMQLERHF